MIMGCKLKYYRARELMRRPETDGVEDSATSVMSAFVLHFAETFSQPRVLNAAGSGGGFFKGQR